MVLAIGRHDSIANRLASAQPQNNGRQTLRRGQRAGGELIEASRAHCTKIARRNCPHVAQTVQYRGYSGDQRGKLRRNMELSQSKPWAVDVQPASFQADVVERSHQVPVVIDFYADWCRPCQLLAPALEKAIEKHAGRILLAKVDTERMPEIAAEFGVSSIPAVFGLRDGTIADQFVGMLSEPELEMLGRWSAAFGGRNVAGRCASAV